MVGEAQYGWEEHYLAAILETDNTKLPERLDKAHAAIARRRQELSDHGGTTDEQRELSHACHGLTVLKKERIDDCLGGYAN